jgi:hypothetical protein
MKTQLPIASYEWKIAKRSHNLDPIGKERNTSTDWQQDWQQLHRLQMQPESALRVKTRK